MRNCVVYSIGLDGDINVAKLGKDVQIFENFANRAVLTIWTFYYQDRNKIRCAYFRHISIVVQNVYLYKNSE